MFLHVISAALHNLPTELHRLVRRLPAEGAVRCGRHGVQARILSAVGGAEQGVQLLGEKGESAVVQMIADGAQRQLLRFELLVRILGKLGGA